MIYKNKTNNENFSGNLNYKRCQNTQINPIIRKIFKNHNINQDNTNWHIYMPCGYNNIDNELKTLHNNKDKLIFGIDGCDNIISKNNMWNIILNYYGRKIANKLCPNTYTNTITDITRLKIEYKKDNTYILKKNIQSQKGLYITRNIDDIEDKMKKGYVVVQEMLKNPFTINRLKINLRIYVLVVCEGNNKKIYYHENGIVYYTPKPYKENSVIIDENITSGYIYENNNNPKNTYDLYKWIQNKGMNITKFRNNMHSLLKKVFIALKNHICNDNYLKENKTFQLFGVDLAPDNQMEFKIIEINKGPNMKIVHDNYDKATKGIVMNDVFDKVGIIKSNYRNGFITLW